MVVRLSLERAPKPAPSVCIVPASVCLIGWLDHPRRAGDQKREETAHANPPAPRVIERIGGGGDSFQLS